MTRIIVIAFFIAIVGVASAKADAANGAAECGNSKVTASQFDAVQVTTPGNQGWSRWRVQQFFDNCGTRIVMFADNHRHLAKQYPGVDGQAFIVWFRGRLTQHPLKAPYHAESKEAR